MSEINNGEPFWLFASRRCPTELLELIDIFKGFVYSVVFAKHRQHKKPEPTTLDDLHEWSQRMSYRVGWDGDLVASILCILRLATDSHTVPNVVVFDGDWDLPVAQQQPSSSPGQGIIRRGGVNPNCNPTISCFPAPEVIVLHPGAVKSIARMDD